MKRHNIGSSFDAFLIEEGALEDAAAVAIKRVIVKQIALAMKKQKMSKTSLAEKMHTSRASLHRMLDESDACLTFATLVGAATALGMKIKIELLPI